MTTPLEKVKDLNYDHHRRMTEMYDRQVLDGTDQQYAAIDDLSYRNLLDRVPGGRDFILELGSAQGKQWPLLREWLHPEGQIFGIDLYEPLVLKAHAKGLVNIRVGFVEDMHMFPDDSFDLVCSRHVMEHLGDLYQGMAEILRVTKSGGYIAHVTPDMIVDQEPAHLNHLKEHEWKELWTQGRSDRRADGTARLSWRRSPHRRTEAVRISEHAVTDTMLLVLVLELLWIFAYIYVHGW